MTVETVLEASQVYSPASLSSMLVMRRVVFVGTNLSSSPGTIGSTWLGLYE